mmetsp:Transcript_60059/g.173139  ORF Transcript_60059/g.173139 Transcript_60059/m.173139 type:complete len:252 (-) Transcript_60059:32-787(-)
MAVRNVAALSLVALSSLAAPAFTLTLRAGSGSLARADAVVESQSEEPFVLSTLASARDELYALLQMSAPANATKIPPAAVKSPVVAKAAAGNKTAAEPLKHPGMPSSKSHEALMKQHAALQDLLAHLKANIKNINKGEVGGKEVGQKEIEQIKQRLAHEQEQLKNTSISSFQRELLVNRTRSDKHALEYWTRSRELEHGMFHSSLKMTHGLMAKVNAVMKAYEDVLKTGALSPKSASALKTVADRLPKPAF